MDTYRRCSLKFIIFVLGILSQVVAFEAKADSPLEIIGVYVDSTSRPGIFPEIILYKQDGKMGGTYNQGFPNQENPKGFLQGGAPLEDIRLAPNGVLSFSIPHSMRNQLGFVKQHHYFTGQLQNNIIQGSFTSDTAVSRPPPINASKRTSVDLKQDVLEYVLTKKRITTDGILELNRIIECQKKRDSLPQEDINVIGRWFKYGSDGQNEWGYEVILFKVGNEFHGWLEDYEGMIGDGGIRYPISDIHLSKGKLNFKVRDIVGYETAGKDSQLELHTSGEVSILDKTKQPEVDLVWREYQSLKVKCE
jgi:hypothetical protein